MSGQCSHTLWDLPDGLTCVEDGPHETHRYVGRSVGDRHDASEAAAERGRG